MSSLALVLERGGGLGGVGEDVEGFEPAVFFCEVTFLRVDRDIGGRAI